MEHSYFKNTCILQNIWLPHVSSLFLQSDVLRAIYIAHYKSIHQLQPRKTTVEEQLEMEGLSNGCETQQDGFFTPCLSLDYFLVFLVLLAGILLNSGKPYEIYPGCCQNKLLIISDVVPKSIHHSQFSVL